MCDERAARALLGAAVRETFEETGVLLSVPVADLSGARGDVEAGRVSFGDLLRENGLAVDSDALQPWSRWITPQGESRRYDTRFFVGALPDGVEAAGRDDRVVRGELGAVGEALEQAQRGERMLLPPTLATLASLARFEFGGRGHGAAAERSLEPISPTIRRGADGTLIAELPDGTSFTLPASMFR